jgi:hypothetical protein
MTSITDICNRALDEIGARAVIANLNEASLEATTCARHYDNCRRMLLRTAPWGFARKQANLALLGDLTSGTSPQPWQYKYQYPADCVLFRYIMSPVGLPRQPDISARFLLNYEDANQTILSNVSQAIGVYNADVQDPTRFDDLFQNALTLFVASKLAIPLTGNAGIKQAMEALLKDAVVQARASDANEGLTSSGHVPDWIAGRGADCIPLFAQGLSCGPWIDLALGTV